ncbi:tyrosine-type recombinase/integrase [Streptomyces sp. NPDC051997]|uniref:tyrosine-type recombinase/integrase n=1 Tax=Streptomyces sp. NPDC051997 TaxID=3155611 RepID=UPI00343C9A85
MDDGLIERNPCRVKGAGTVTHTERPFLFVPEVYRLADAVPPHCRVLVLLAAFAALRFGELAALQRRDIDLEARTVSVRRSYSETRTDGLTVKAPKSAAGVRTVAFPVSLVPEPAHHLAAHAEAGRTGLVFVGARGGVLRRNNFRRIWLRTLAATGLGDIHFHDLRHTENDPRRDRRCHHPRADAAHGPLVGAGRAGLPAPRQRARARDRRLRGRSDQEGAVPSAAVHLACEWHGSPRRSETTEAQITGITPADLGLVHVLRLVGADGFEPPTSAL